VIDTAPGKTVSVVHTDITAADSATSLGEAPTAV
jgi:hypothetical protein